MFYAGFARLDITPPLGIPLTGYYRSRYADGVLDPLEINALAVSDGEKKAVLLAADLILIDEACSTEIREKVAAENGLEKEAVLIHCLHQHTAPHVGKGECIPLVDYLKDGAYLDLLYRKFSDAAAIALSDLSEAKISTASCDTAEPLSFVRRFRMKDGSTRTNPGALNPDVVGPIGEADNSVRLIRFEREGKRDLALVSFSTHQDTISGNKYSADWGGALRRQGEKRLKNTRFVAISGYQGDVNHVDIQKPSPASIEEAYAHCQYMGKVLVDAVEQMWNRTEPVRGSFLWTKTVVKNIPTNTAGIERAEECWEIYRKSMNKTLGYKLEFGEKADMGRIGSLPKSPVCQKLVVSLLGIGSAALLGVGGEPFTYYAVKAREAASDLFLMTACLVNGGEAYFPTQEAYDEGGYEARTSRMAPACAKALLDTSAALLREYSDERQRKGD
ncbi:MAG: hypothetical protein IKD31_00575 [Clostridia bacterium]|nr:hypothetical protein [Clostridia bacterium]